MLLDFVEHTGSLAGSKCPSDELVKIGLCGGSFFYTRLCYLPDTLPDVGCDVSEEELPEVLSAGSCYLAERYALECLARLEYSRYQLSAKLFKKGFESLVVKKTLDFLEKMSYLDDRRFAEAWLRSRTRKYPEGKPKLLAGLLSRGIDTSLASAVLSDFFQELPESDLLAAAYDKLRHTKKSEVALVRALQNKGFSLSSIAQYVDVPFYG